MKTTRNIVSKPGEQEKSWPSIHRLVLTNYVLVMAILTACLEADAEVMTKTLMHDDREREYILHVPSSYDANRPMPLVLALHGAGQNGETQMRDSRMNEVSEREGFLVAYPSALEGSWARDTPDINLGFFDDLLETIQADYSIDASRVYSTGLSQGAVRSYMLAVERPNVFAAIAPVAGVRPLLEDGTVFPEGLPSTPSRSLPMMHVHGTLDSIVPIEGGRGISLFPSVESVITEWVDLNGCDSPASVNVLPDDQPDDNRFVTLHEFEGCSSYTRTDGTEGSAEVRFYEVNRGGHEWFRNPRLDTSSIVWDFFSNHSLPKPAIRGDFDGNDKLDANDIDLLSEAVGSSGVHFDLDENGHVDHHDREIWITDLSNSYFGDANLDGEFNSGDLVQAFQRGEYEDSIASNSGWADGDWNGDKEFDSGDFVLAFQTGGYEMGRRSSIANVPEPNTLALGLIGGIFAARLRRRSVGNER